ncbi:MAG: ribosome small subunit-dependent GTPase A [Planctomycetota bacterium]|nr:ribosome small subunit-dependent GTPase A [Planctomycetota bacterium]
MAGKKSGGPRKRGKKVRVDLRRNRSKSVRDKSAWTKRFEEGAIEQDDARKSESVRAKGDLSRKRTIIVGDETDEATWRRGTVVAMRGLVAEVDDGQEVWACTVRRMLRTRLIGERHPVAIGDRVRFSEVGGGSRKVSESKEMAEGVIEEVADRITTLTRHYDRRDQVIAANVNCAVICMAADEPTLRPHLIDRYLVAVHIGDMRPVICINKSDLDRDGVAAEVAARYTRIGYSALLTSVTEPRGLDEMRDTLCDQTSVFVGPSGVGKSSLLNSLDRNLSLKVGEMTDLGRGRHTTTTSCLLKWAFGGYVVDTPGIRQFELTRVPSQELEAYFKEFVGLVPNCRFPSCSHTHEADCAILAAVEDGDIDPARYESYCRMYQECVEKEKNRT